MLLVKLKHLKITPKKIKGVLRAIFYKQQVLEIAPPPNVCFFALSPKKRDAIIFLLVTKSQQHGHSLSSSSSSGW